MMLLQVTFFRLPFTFLHVRSLSLYKDHTRKIKLIILTDITFVFLLTYIDSLNSIFLLCKGLKPLPMTQLATPM